MLSIRFYENVDWEMASAKDWVCLFLNRVFNLMSRAEKFAKENNWSKNFPFLHFFFFVVKVNDWFSKLIIARSQVRGDDCAIENELWMDEYENSENGS